MTTMTDPMCTPSLALRIIRQEFQEMPGMRLTLAQAARLWDMPEARCESLLEGLIADGFLALDPERRYARCSLLHRTTPIAFRSPGRPV
jgi:hypothetical protein